ncbi:MAG: Membrane protein insertase YidC [Chromatiales bacterium USCg_Taylor]|nr:MAG: Membrane protein insertase YidC [Chromatiales bacterium USCg_Taylor]
MDNVRLLMIAGLCIVSLLIWQAWQRDYGSLESPWSRPTTGEATAPNGTDVPTVEDGKEASAAVSDQEAEPEGKEGSYVRVTTDVLDLDINKIGAVIEKAKLREFPVSVDAPDKPFVFLDRSESLTFVVQGGLRSTDVAPDHHSEYRSEQNAYELENAKNSLKAVFTWGPVQGLTVRKIYTFERGSYLVNSRYEIVNEGPNPWAGRVYGQLQRSQSESGYGFIYTYTGAAISSLEKRYEKIDFDDMQEKPVERDVANGWAAILQHYFVAALVPDPKETYHYYSKILDDGKRYLIGLYGPEVSVPSGADHAIDMKIYLGPKLQHVLEKIAPGLELTVDYGVLWFIGKPIFWLLEKLHSFIGNWGWAIVFVTVILKVMFFQLSAASYRSMAKMKKLQPRLQALRERHEDDRMKMNQAVMDLYKEEKVNPFGGCLPILVQIPVFIALYWVLLESVELRQAPFGYWIKDLSAPDPYFVLPVLMGVTMLIQYKLNPTPIDPMQQKIMQLLPIVLTVFFSFFPSGLVLYWLANNVLSIGQQWLINKQYGEAAHPAKAG